MDDWDFGPDPQTATAEAKQDLKRKRVLKDSEPAQEKAKLPAKKTSKDTFKKRQQNAKGEPLEALRSNSTGGAAAPETKPAKQGRCKVKSGPPDNTLGIKKPGKPPKNPDAGVPKPVVPPSFNEELGIPTRLALGVDCAGMMPEGLALEELKIKFKVKFASEKDPTKRRLMTHLHGSNFRVFETVDERTSAKTFKCDLQTGGFPCQSFSTAGKHAGFGDTRGIVVMDIVKGLDHFRPRLLIFENVQGLVVHHNSEFQAILQMLNSRNYIVHWRILTTRDYNIPQSRPRVYIVCLRNDSVKCNFEWPPAAPLQTKAKKLLDAFATDRKTADMLGPGATQRLNQAKESIIDNGGTPESEYWFVDVGASEKFATWSKDMCPCITKGRGIHGFFVTHKKINGMMRIEEIMRAQGFDPKRMDWQTSGVCKTDWGHALGDAMSLNVLKLVMYNACKAAGLIAV